MSKININDYNYRYPKEAIAQWKETGIIPEELKTDNLAFLIRDGKNIIVSKNSKINFKYAKGLFDKHLKEISEVKVGEIVEIKYKEVDIQSMNTGNGILVRFTCQVFTLDNLIDVINQEELNA